MNPRAYNKNSMVRGMDRRVAKAQSEEEQMYEFFFEKSPEIPEKIPFGVKDYIKDHVSKDMDIPWHQVKPEQVQQWRDKGFHPVKYEEWWKEPNEEEKKRNMKMMSGASLRKDL
jgi:hypothetical protein